MANKEIFRKILIHISDSTYRVVGTLKQTYSETQSNFYFFPPFQYDADGNRSIDHASFHFSGQSHMKFVDKSKNLITSKNDCIHQRDLGAFMFLAMSFDPTLLPICPAPQIGDVLLDASKIKSYLWFEFCFISSDFLLNNRLGFGTVLSDVSKAPSLIDRKVFVAGHLPDTNHMAMQFTCGVAERLLRPDKIEIRTFNNAQRRHTDSL